MHGPYALQAAIAACHARAAARTTPTGRASRPSTTDLAERHAVAGRRAQPRRRASRWPTDPPPASSSSTSCSTSPSLRTYHLLPTVRGDFLSKLGRYDEARAEFERAASLTRNTRERDLLLNRAAALAWQPPKDTN